MNGLAVISGRGINYFTMTLIVQMMFKHGLKMGGIFCINRHTKSAMSTDQFTFCAYNH